MEENRENEKRDLRPLFNGLPHPTCERELSRRCDAESAQQV